MKKAYRHWGNFADSDCSDLDEIDTAITYCSLATKINPQNAAAYSLRGSMYNYKHWHKRAFRDLNKALSLGLNDEDVYYGLGFAHLLCEEYCNIWFETGINHFKIRSFLLFYDIRTVILLGVLYQAE